MAWFRWRKNSSSDVEEEVEQTLPEAAAPPEVIAPVVVEPVVVEPEFVPAPPVEPVVVEPEFVPAPPVEPVVVEPEFVPAPPVESVVVEPVVVEPVVVEPEAVPAPPAHPAAPLSPPAAVWNAGLGGVVVRIVHTAPSLDGSAADIRAALESALALAVGPHSPAPADADPEHPIILNVTIAQETVDAEVTETLASARKQLARRAVRVRLVVDQAPLDEIV